MVFFDKGEVKKKDKHHFCAHFLLSAPLKRDVTPTPTKIASHCCSICTGQSRPVFSDNKELMRHITLAHSYSFFKSELERKGMDVETGRCVWAGCEVVTQGWQAAIEHNSIDHQKLFWRLKHDKKNDFSKVVKKLFPDKFKKYSDLDFKKSSDKEPIKERDKAKREANS